MDKPLPPWMRSLFYLTAAIFALIGLFLFIAPELLATLPADVRGDNAWPWPIGPLALRFVAALALAGALADFLTARRFDRRTVAAYCTIMGSMFGFLLLHVVVSAGSIQWSKPLAAAYLIVLLLGFVGSVGGMVWMRRGLALTSLPLPPTPPFAKSVPLFISILTVIVGGTMFFLPEIGRARWPWDLISLVNVQFLGAVFLSVAASTFWVWRQPSWYGYDVFYPAAGTFAAIALVASFLHWNLFSDHPITSILFVIVYAVGAFLGFFPYFRDALPLRRGLPA